MVKFLSTHKNLFGASSFICARMVRAPKNYTELALYFQKSTLAMIHTNYTFVISDDFDLMLSLQKKSSEEKRAKYPDIAILLR